MHRNVHTRLSRPMAVSVRANASQLQALGGKKVVIVGGTGRMGSSTAAALFKSFPDLSITLGSRSVTSFEGAVARRPELAQAKFVKVDVEDVASVRAALSGADLVINAAGPFQRTENHSVLEEAIGAKVAYIDVSDDTAFSERSKSQYAAAAAAAGVPAIVSAGIFPGTSNVMAAHMISISRKEYDEDGNLRDSPDPGGIEPDWLRYTYYTAGSGGAGTTILETSLLLAGEDVVVFKDGKEIVLPPVSNRREVDFGPGIGFKGTYLYNLPEVLSAYKHLKVKGVSARFGTDPFFWNWTMWLLARVVPRSLLRDRGFVKVLAGLAAPLVRASDLVTGESVAMKVEVDFEKGKKACGVFVHGRLSETMGLSVAGFAQAVLQGQTRPGVWYPEEREALADRRGFLDFVSAGTSSFTVNKPAWSMESEIQSFAGMLYW